MQEFRGKNLSNKKIPSGKGAACQRYKDWKIERTEEGGGRVRIKAVKSIVHTVLKLKEFFVVVRNCL